MKYTLLALLFSFSLYSHALTGLNVGTDSPKIFLKDSKGEIFDSTKVDKNIVYVFFRGSWCPYCVQQIKSLNANLYPDLKEKDVELVAISVDKIAKANRMQKIHRINFPLLSDTKAKYLKEFKIINKLDAELVKKYKSAYSIDIEGDSGEKHHMIAHPAVFIVNKKGKIIFSDVHTDYKQRTKIEDIKKALNL